LGKFIASPVHNKHPVVRQLYDFFKRHAQQEDGEFPDPGDLSEHLFGPEGRGLPELRHGMNYFQRVLESFLAWQEWEERPLAREKYLAQALRRKQLIGQAQSGLKKMQAENERQPFRNARYCRLEYTTVLEAHQLSLLEGKPDSGLFQTLSNWHDIAFISEKMQHACLVVSLQRVHRQDFNTGLLQAVLDHVRQQPSLLEHPAIAVYYYGYRALTEPDEESHFKALRKELAVHRTCFTADELRDIHLLAINFCIYQINRRQEHYLHEVLDLYRSGLESGIFVEHGQLPRFTYTNIVSTALRLQEFDWAYEFIEAYKGLLPEAQRNGTYSFNLARYYSDKGDYNKAMPLLQQMDFDDPLLNLQGKMMLVKMYYETGAFIALDSLITSLEAYLRRKKHLGVQQQAAHRNAVRLIRRLLALSDRDKSGREKLKQELEATDVVAMKEWILQILS
jgi:tetratricopeptide (TPR) repeat protein